MSRTILILIALCLVAIAGSVVYDRYTLSRGMPPGYGLECDQHDHYRPIHIATGVEVFWIQDYGTKPEAIRRAWRQYEFDTPKTIHTWTKCTP